MVTAGQLGRKSGQGFYDYALARQPRCRTGLERGVPIEPPPTPLGVPARRRRRRATAWSASAPTSSPAPCWPPTGRACSRCRSDGGRRSPGGRPTPAGSSRSTGCGSPGRCARSCRRYEVRVDTAFADGDRACADPARDGGWINRRRHRRLHAASTSSAGPTASRPGSRTASWSAASTAWPSAASSPASRCSTDARDASKVALVGLVERLRARRRRAARRAVDDPPPRPRSARSTCPGPSTSSRLGRRRGSTPAQPFAALIAPTSAGVGIGRSVVAATRPGAGPWTRMRRAGDPRARPPVADAHLLGPLHGQGVQRALPHQPGQGPDRPVDRLRPAHPDRLRPRRPPRPGRGRQGRRARRPPRPHAPAARRHPAGRDEHVDDDQRPGGVAARPLRGQRREPGRAQSRQLRGTTQNDIVKEYLQPRHLHLPAASPAAG